MEELKYTEGFLKSVQGKLKNERFVSGAPQQVVALERQKGGRCDGEDRNLESEFIKP